MFHHVSPRREVEAARAYDLAVRQLKGPEAEAYVNFKECDPNAAMGMSKIVRASKKLRAIGVVFPEDSPDGMTKRARHDGEYHHSHPTVLTRTRSMGHSHTLEHEDADVDITPLSIHASHSFVGSGPSMRSCHTAEMAFSGTHGPLLRHCSENTTNQSGALSFHGGRDGPMAVHNPFAAYESGSGHSDRGGFADHRPMHDYGPEEFHAAMAMPPRYPAGREELGRQLMPAHSEPLWQSMHGGRGHLAMFDRWAQEMEAREMWAARAFPSRTYSVCPPGEMYRREWRPMASYDRRSVVMVRRVGTC